MIIKDETAIAFCAGRSRCSGANHSTTGTTAANNRPKPANLELWLRSEAASACLTTLSAASFGSGASLSTCSTIESGIFFRSFEVIRNALTYFQLSHDGVGLDCNVSFNAAGAMFD